MGKASKSAPSVTPVSAGSATIERTAPTAGQVDDAPALPTLVLDWDPHKIGAENDFESERGEGPDDNHGPEGNEIDVTDADVIVVPPNITPTRREPDAETETPARADRRRAVLAALEREKGQRGAEAQARASRDAATAAQQRADAAEARIAAASKGTLQEKLAFLGLTKEELTDAIILNGGEVDAATAGAKPDAAVSKDVAELRAELKKLQDAEAARTQATEQTKVQQQAERARAEVRTLIKDEPAPLAKALKAEDRILGAAWNAWKARPASQRTLNVSDFVPDAAAVIEDVLRAENPDLAALVPKTGGAAPARGAEATPTRRAPAVGRRNGPSRSPGTSTQLSYDPDERTRQIARENGWDL